MAAARPQAALARSFGGATVLLVAHRLADVLGCDAVVVMEAGRVAESGEPGELLRRGPGRSAFACLAGVGGVEMRSDS